MADIIVRMPDGAELKFPAGTPTETVTREANNYFMRQKSGGSGTQVEPSMLDRAARAFFPPENQPAPSVAPKAGSTPQRLGIAPFQGYLDAGASVLGAPFEASNWIAEKLGMKRETATPLGQRFWQNAIDQATLVPGRAIDAVRQGSTAPLTEPRTNRIMPSTDAEKVLYGAGRGVGDAVAVLGGAGAASKLGGTTGAVAREVAQMPKTQLAAGAAGGAVGEATDNPLYGLAAGLGVGMGVRPLGNAVRAVSEPFTAPGQKRIVGTWMAENANRSPEELAEELRRAQLAGERVPGSTPTSAEAIKSAGLANAERALRNDGRNVQQFSDRDSARNIARQSHLDTIAQGSSGAPTVANVVRNRVADYTRASETPLVGANARAAQSVAAAQTGNPPDLTGRVIRGAFDDAYGAQRGQTRQAYDEARDLSANVDVGTEGLVQRLRATMADIYGNDTVGPPASITRAIEEISGGQHYVAGRADPQPRFITQLGALERLKKSVMAAAPREGTDRHAAGRFAADIDTYIDGMIPELPEDVAQAYMRARAARTREGERFTHKDTAQFNEPLTAREYGAPTIRESAIPANYWRPGEPGMAAMRQFRDVMGSNPAAMTAIRDHARDQFRAAAVRDGRLNIPAARAWMQQYEGALAEVPSVRQQITDAITAAQAVDDIGRTRARGLSDLSNSVLGRIAEGDPTKAFDAIMAADNPVRAAGQVRFELAGNDRAQEALKRAAVEWMQSKAVPGLGTESVGGTVSPSRFVNATRGRERLLRAAGLSPEEIAKVEAVRADIVSQAFPQNAGRSVGSNTLQNAMSQRMFDQLAGGLPVSMIPGGKEYLAPFANFAARPGSGREQAIRALATDAALNPRTAEEVMRAAGGTGSARMRFMPGPYLSGVAPFMDQERNR